MAQEIQIVEERTKSSQVVKMRGPLKNFEVALCGYPQQNFKNGTKIATGSSATLNGSDWKVKLNNFSSNSCTESEIVEIIKRHFAKKTA